MKAKLIACLCGAALFAQAQTCPAQASGFSKAEATLNQAAKDLRTTYLLFYRDGDATTSAMAQELKAFADKNAVRWQTVQITDAAEKSIVDSFQVSRAPMPMVLAVNPNGAITGFFQKSVGEPQLVQCLVSPKKADCMKALQQDRLVLLCVQSSSAQAIPQAVGEFQADPNFAKRTQIITANLSDPQEAAFFGELKIAPQANGPQTVFLAPPGVLVGRFAANASKSDLATALHAAGKCCDDKNCKHNHK